jgi:NADP-dependent 3-hydroxy acid dehydrogenase YdfG
MSHYFITGASAGIGAALAKMLADDGHTVSAVARRKQRLAEIENSTDLFRGYAADVRDADAIAAAVTSSHDIFGPVDVAILNAGIYVPQDGKHIEPGVYADHMNINYMGVVNALAAVVPKMLAAWSRPYYPDIVSCRVARSAQGGSLRPHQSGVDLTCRVAVF